MKSSLLLALGGLATTFAAPHAKRSGYEVKDSHPVPAQWTRIGKPSAVGRDFAISPDQEANWNQDHRIQLQIGLKQNSFNELERHLYEVSDPDHARYGQHLSAEQVGELIAPTSQSLSSVHDWLEENSVRLDQVEYSPAKDWIMVALPVSEVEHLLDTEYHVYEDNEGSQVVRTPEYSLPLPLHRHIDVIQPTNYFGRPRAMRNSLRLAADSVPPYQEYTGVTRVGNQFSSQAANLSAACNASVITSVCLRTLYNTIDYTPKVPQKNFVGVTAYLNETANYSDFHIFLSQQRKDASPQYQYNYTLIAGAINHQDPETTYYGIRDVEAGLDVQTVGGFVYPTKFSVYSTGGSPPFKPDVNTPTDTNEPYLTWIQYMQKLKTVPYTVSTSYDDDEQSVPYNYATRVCQEFAQFGARGVSLLFASGDSGVGTNGTCISNDGKNSSSFLPEFPSTCPYITSVGATRNIQPEIVAFDTRNGFVSGSGTSYYFPQPGYQAGVVNKYLSSIGNLHKGLFNPRGRAYPDIAAQGYHFLIVYGGKNILVDGTSAATPAAAGVLTNVNDALIASGRPPLGFLNPWLYKYGYKAFNDITIGNTYGCNTSGFPAQKGWDLASGFGTPDFKKITALFQGPPSYGGQ